jgi:tetratricopeptide (TPR) repeat protein
LHVELARKKSFFWDRKHGYGLAKLKTVDTQPQIQTCAPCHARRSVHAPDFQAGDNFYDYFNNELLAENTYFADGQILDEDYVFGSFIQSKMYHKDIRCTDCHNPHTARLKHEGNQVCTSCHQHAAAKYDTPAHHFHKSDSTGASCVECHMPETTYMEVDPRRDHSIRIPRPDLSLAIGTPNACTRCHLSDAEISDEKRSQLKQYIDWIRVAREGDEELQRELARLDQWMLESMQKWYQKESWGESFAFALQAGRRGEPDAAEQLAALARDGKQPAIARATALYQRGMLPQGVSDLSAELDALKDPDPQVRVAAVSRFYDEIPTGESISDQRVLEQLEMQLAPVVQALVPLLDDPRLVVRAEVGRVLARLPAPLASALLSGAQRNLLDKAVDEYIAGVWETRERGGAHLELAVLYETMGRTDRAEEAYRTAIRVEPGLTGPRSNLAALLDRRSEMEMNRIRQLVRGNRSLLDQDRIQQMVANVSQEAERLASESSTLRREELALLERDVSLVPDNAPLQYRYGLSLHLHDQPEKARQALERACELAPENDQFQFALALFYDDSEQYALALDRIDQALRLRPGAPQYLQLREAIEAKMQQ